MKHYLKWLVMKKLIDKVILFKATEKNYMSATRKDISDQLIPLRQTKAFPSMAIKQDMPI